MGTEGRTSAALWVVTLGMAVVAVVLGYVGLDMYLPTPQGVPPADTVERLYSTLQMFVLSSSAVAKGPYPGPLAVALFLAPLTTVLAVLQAVSTAFRARYLAWRLRRARGHAVVVGAGPAAFVLAQRLAAGTPRRTTWWKRPLSRTRWRARWRLWRRMWRAARWRALSTLLRRAPTTVLVGSDIAPVVARRHRMRVVAGDPMDTATLRAAGVAGAAHVFALSDTGAVNAGVALAARTLNQAQRAAEQRRRPVRWRGRARSTMAVFARADDARLVAALRARRLGAEGFQPDDGYTLDFFSIEQRAAVKLLDEHDTAMAPTAVVGSDLFSAAVVAELTRRRRRAHRHGDVAVRPTAAAHTVPAAATTVYVCATDPDEVLRIGLQMLLRGHAHVVLCLGRRSMLADALERRLFADVDGRLTVFGVLDAGCDPTDMRQDALLERLAQALHAHYLREHAPAIPTKPSELPWSELPERYRNSNRAQAEHIGVKLAAIDALIVPVAPDLPGFAFLDAGEVERLAVMEHERWMHDLEARHAASGTVEPITHRDYLDWDDGLSEEAKNKDRLFVRELPALLAAEGLAIVRQPPTGT